MGSAARWVNFLSGSGAGTKSLRVNTERATNSRASKPHPRSPSPSDREGQGKSVWARVGCAVPGAPLDITKTLAYRPNPGVRGGLGTARPTAEAFEQHAPEISGVLPKCRSAAVLCRSNSRTPPFSRIPAQSLVRIYPSSRSFALGQRALHCNHRSPRRKERTTPIVRRSLTKL